MSAFERRTKRSPWAIERPTGSRLVMPCGGCGDIAAAATAIPPQLIASTA
jgi:hypothetical protein